jgi:hypothetical protein
MLASSVVESPPTVLQLAGRTEPDLPLIKQAEQGDNLWFWRTGLRLARIRSIGITGAIEVLLFPIWQSLALRGSRSELHDVLPAEANVPCDEVFEFSSDIGLKWIIRGWLLLLRQFAL